MSKEDIKALATQFDHTSPDQMNDPYAMYEAFRTQCPVGRSQQHSGFYFAARHETVKKVIDDYSTFSSSAGVGIPPHPYEMYPIDLDPPRQTKFRRILNRRFTVEAVATKNDEIQQEVHRLIDGFIGRGSADLAEELVRPLLPAIVLPMLGVPYADQPQVSAWIEYLTRGRGNDMEGVMKAGNDIGAYLMGVVARRRNEAPVDDVVGLLLESQVDGESLNDEQIFRTLLIILFGGLDTTSAVLLESLLFLARNPEEKHKLLSGERDWTVAIEEFVRYTSPIQGLRRTVKKETEIDGQPLTPGDWVFVLHGSANRDADVFADADKCLLDRSPNPHLAFGGGAHICLGRNLARLEIRILLSAVLQRLGDYTVVEGFKPEYLVGEARGMKRLPVTFTPGAVRATTAAATAQSV